MFLKSVLYIYSNNVYPSHVIHTYKPQAPKNLSLTTICLSHSYARRLCLLFSQNLTSNKLNVFKTSKCNFYLHEFTLHKYVCTRPSDEIINELYSVDLSQSQITRYKPLTRFMRTVILKS